jgi:hypothetical protein
MPQIMKIQNEPNFTFFNRKFIPKGSNLQNQKLQNKPKLNIYLISQENGSYETNPFWVRLPSSYLFFLLSKVILPIMSEISYCGVAAGFN